MDQTQGARLPYPEGSDIPRIAEELADLARTIDPRGFQSHESLARIASANTVYGDQRGMLSWQDDNTGNVWAYIGPGTAVGDLVAPDSDTNYRRKGWVLLAELIAQSGDYRQVFNVGAIPINLDVQVAGGAFAATAVLTAPPTGEDGVNNAYKLPENPPGRKYRVYFSAWAVLTPTSSSADWDLVMRLGTDLGVSGKYASIEVEGPVRGAQWCEGPMTSFLASAGDVIKWDVQAYRRSGSDGVEVGQAEDSRGAWVVAWPEETGALYLDPANAGYLAPGALGGTPVMPGGNIAPAPVMTDETLWIGFGYGYAFPQPAAAKVAAGIKINLNTAPTRDADHHAFVGFRFPLAGTVGGFVLGERYRVSITATCAQDQPQRWRTTLGYVASAPWVASTSAAQTSVLEFVAQKVDGSIGIEVEAPVGGWGGVQPYTVTDVVIEALPSIVTATGLPAQQPAQTTQPAQPTGPTQPQPTGPTQPAQPVPTQSPILDLSPLYYWPLQGASPLVNLASNVDLQAQGTLTSGVIQGQIEGLVSDGTQVLSTPSDITLPPQMTIVAAVKVPNAAALSPGVNGTLLGNWKDRWLLTRASATKVESFVHFDLTQTGGAHAAAPNWAQPFLYVFTVDTPVGNWRSEWGPTSFLEGSSGDWASTTLPYEAAPLYLFNRAGSTSSGQAGVVVGHVAIWNRVLSAQEIADLRAWLAAGKPFG